MSKPKILMQLDGDAHASVFDAVVAIDAGVDHLLQYHGVGVDNVRELVHGAMFTRGPQDLQQTAIFIGGSNVAAGERLLKEITRCFFASLRVSVLLDANGANTTAAAAVLAARQCVDLSRSQVTVLAGTGPVGQRAARLLAGEGATVRIASRSLGKAREACDAVRLAVASGRVEPVQTADAAETLAAIDGSQAVIAAGAAGVELLSDATRRGSNGLQALIDLNAVPPVGITGVDPLDKGKNRDGVLCYGAIGIGGTKMKIHRAAIRKLFESNDQVLDAEQVYALGRDILGS
ncbi:MAG: bifunctional NADP-dependent methylenetetrahydromethanopterin dehydrogenase/methylenetetrahydrofolate dehydrogenase [Planctomycetes bacterium]|nr:bifunctional NADP-dependent methylenetetrahydromethanopterin dehydrogenase/methylenetetrahydrofolate dehydrogenase [Planctomycetota bacterium]